jgi:hypothetical protein
MHCCSLERNLRNIQNARLQDQFFHDYRCPGDLVDAGGPAGILIATSQSDQSNQSPPPQVFVPRIFHATSGSTPSNGIINKLGSLLLVSFHVPVFRNAFFEKIPFRLRRSRLAACQDARMGLDSHFATLFCQRRIYGCSRLSQQED